MNRRDALRSAACVGAASLVALAGCASRGDGEDNGDRSTTTTPTTSGESPSTTATGTDPTTDGDRTTAGPPDVTVEMVTDGDEYYFDPIGVFVEAGDVVAWEIRSGTHSTTAYDGDNGDTDARRIPDGAEGWNSSTVAGSGTTFRHSPATAGTYDYFCIPHEPLGMVGRVVVGEPGGPAESDRPPAGNVPDSDRIVAEGAVAYRDFEG